MNSTEYREYLASLEPLYQTAMAHATPLHSFTHQVELPANQFVLTWDNGMESWHTSYGLDLDKAIREFDYLSRSDATSHTIYPATVEILFNGIVIRSYGN